MDSTRNTRYYVEQPSDDRSGNTESQSHSQMHGQDDTMGMNNSAYNASASYSRPMHISTVQGEDSQEQNKVLDDDYTDDQDGHASSMFFKTQGPGRPELTLLTSPEHRTSKATSYAPQAFTSTDLAHERRDRLAVETSSLPRRTASVSDRSPLQNLEAKLGDISKEEKRARVEQAEQRARERASLGSNNSAAAPIGHSAQAVHRKPVPHSNAGSERVGRQQRTEQVQPTSPRDGRNYERFQSSSNPVSSVEQHYSAADFIHSHQTARLDSHTSNRMRGGGYGHDSSLTGGAAAAAVDAYQAVRRRRYDKPPAPRTDRETFDTSPKPSSHNHEPRYGVAQETNPTTDSRELPHRNAEASEHELNLDDPHASHTEKDHKSLGARITSKFTSKTKHVVSPESVATSGSHGPSYEQPPQVATGVHARQAVHFGLKNPNEEALHRHQEDNHRRIHFSDIIEHHDHPERRYVAPKSLHEWKTAGKATLNADDLNLGAVREEGQPRRPRGRTMDGRAGSNHAPEKKPNSDIRASHVQTMFRPMLMLKCGPLLRYAGISCVSEGSREFWRGTIMIVTEDATSMYRPVPTLKLFKQHMDLFPPPPLRIDGETGQQLAPEYVDPLAGQPKTSRTGQTLYVRPVHHLPAETDLSRIESDEGLFEQTSTAEDNVQMRSRISKADGMSLGRYRETQGFRLHAERGVTFWRFNIEVELCAEQTRVAYCINNGPAIGFWVPARGQIMNVMFHSCNGFSMSVDADSFSGPDPMWRDVLNSHQTRPFHCMMGGGDQIYNDAAMRDTEHFKDWLGTKNPLHKHSASFTPELQEELEQFYLNRYSMWFSQGLFGMANSQIPMVNIWDDHDIIDGFGSYPHHFMAAPVFAGLGAVAFKYYMLFQHQSLPDEDEQTEPSWLLGASPGPYINQLSRNLFMSLGRDIMFLGLDCRTERMRDEVLSQETYDIVFDRCRREITHGKTKHLIVLLGVPIAYPRLNWLENVLTSKAMEPFKALGRIGMLGSFVNKFDGGVEILDDLDDHWTAKHHKQERNWFIQELQELAAEKSVRVTILGGDVHLGAIGQFYSNPKLSIPKDQDHRYMPNVISSAIVNTPPPEMMADVMNKRNKVHHLDDHTDEDMIPMFPQDVDGRSRKNLHLLPRRNWCSFREYVPGSTPRSSPAPEDSARKSRSNFSLPRSSSLTRRDPQRGNLLRRTSSRKAPPPSAYRSNGTETPYNLNELDPRVDGPYEFTESNIATTVAHGDQPEVDIGDSSARQSPFHQRPTSLTRNASRRDRSGRDGRIDLQGGLEFTLNCEVDQKDPAGVTTPYRLLIPALSYRGKDDPNATDMRSRTEKMADLIGVGRSRATHRHNATPRKAHESQQDNDSSQRPVEHHDDKFSFGGQTNDNRPLSSGHDAKQYSSPAQSYDRSKSQDRNQTTAYLQRTSIDSERNQPSESTISRLPRSQAPDENQDFFHRHSSKNRNNIAQGPPPPSNIDQLPTSVQKRYQQLNSTNPDHSDYSSSSPNQPSVKQYSSSDRGSSGQYRQTLQDRPISNPPPSSEQDRHYYSGPMEFPLLPVNANQIRSGDKRTNYNPLLAEQSLSQPTQDYPSNTRRVVSGPAAFSQQQQQQPPREAKHTTQPQEQVRQSLPSPQPTAPHLAESRNHFPHSSTYGDDYHRNGTYLEYTAEGPVQRRNPQSDYQEPPAEPPESQSSYQRRDSLQKRGSKVERHYSGLDGTATSPQSTEGGIGAYDPELHRNKSNRNGVVYDHVDDQDEVNSEDLYSENGYEGRLDKPNHGSGIPEKVARHFGGYNANDSGDVSGRVSSGTKGRAGGGLGGLVRRFSEGGKDGKKGWKVW